MGSRSARAAESRQCSLIKTGWTVQPWLVSWDRKKGDGLVSDGKGLNQPACQEEWKKCRRKRRIVMSMWCIYMCAHMSCGVIMFFTCTLVRSHPDSRKALGVKPDLLR
jgi:hypothetical protein